MRSDTAMNSRVWLITGASSGLGLELAQYATAQGDRVIATSRSPRKLAHLGDKGIKVAHLNQNEDMERIKTDVAAIIDIYGTVDVVVNNAAYVQTGVLEEVPPEDTLQQFQTNVFGPLNVFRAVLPHLRIKRAGTLVTIGSMAAWYPMPGCNLYNSSKAALRSLSLGLAGEVAYLGIKHCLVEPGFFRTELLSPTANIAITDSTLRIPDYNELNDNLEASFAQFNGFQLGDSVKGARVMYEVFTSTGCAAGREIPAILPLGSDATTEICKAASQAIADVDEWRAISVSTDFPHGE